MDAEKTHEFMLELLEKSIKKQGTQWPGSRFANVKHLPTTPKGNMAEDFLHQLLRKLGYTQTEVKAGRRGDWDVKARNADREARFEVKLATQDTKGKHQFNGVRQDTDYTHLFALAVLPNELMFKFIPQEDVHKSKYPMVSMSKGVAGSYKMTLDPEKHGLHSFDDFEEEVAKILGKPQNGEPA